MLPVVCALVAHVVAAAAGTLPPTDVCLDVPGHVERMAMQHTQFGTALLANASAGLPCLQHRHLLLLGDSVAQYQAFHLMQSLVQKGWLEGLAPADRNAYISRAWNMTTWDAQVSTITRGRVINMTPGLPLGAGLAAYFDPTSDTVVTFAQLAFEDAKDSLDDVMTMVLEALEDRGLPLPTRVALTADLDGPGVKAALRRLESLTPGLPPIFMTAVPRGGSTEGRAVHGSLDVEAELGWPVVDRHTTVQAALDTGVPDEVVFDGDDAHPQPWVHAIHNRRLLEVVCARGAGAVGGPLSAPQELEAAGVAQLEFNGRVVPAIVDTLPSFGFLSSRFYPKHPSVVTAVDPPRVWQGDRGPWQPSPGFWEFIIPESGRAVPGIMIKPRSQLPGGREAVGDVVLVPTFPRSGSTWFFKYFETATGFQGAATVNEGVFPFFSRSESSAQGFNAATGLNVFSRQDKLPSEPPPPGSSGTFGNALAARQASLPTRAVVVKTHFPWMDLQEWDVTARPNRLLRLVRHPIDVALSSIAYMDWYTGGSHMDSPVSVPNTTNVEEWVQRQLDFTAYWNDVEEQLLKANVPVLTIRYEDLCLRGKVVVPLVLDFLGMRLRDGIVNPDDPRLILCNNHVGFRVDGMDRQLYDFAVEKAMPMIKQFEYERLTEVYRGWTK